jgi:membrane protein YqaA with SNARE-associated domain
MILAAVPDAARAVRHWIYQLGGIGFIPLGLLDASIIPIPGSMDALTIILSARDKEYWFYYAVMATIGAVIGGYVTYRLARRGGKEALSRRFSKKQLDRVFGVFEKWGWGAVAIPAALPPPMPMVPFLFAAGAMQYPLKKFLLALSAGRLARYTVFAFVAARYGRHVLAFIREHGHPVLLASLGVAGAALLVLLYFVMGKRQRIAKTKATA